MLKKFKNYQKQIQKYIVHIIVYNIKTILLLHIFCFRFYIVIIIIFIFIPISIVIVVIIIIIAVIVLSLSLALSLSALIHYLWPRRESRSEINFSIGSDSIRLDPHGGSRRIRFPELSTTLELPRRMTYPPPMACPLYGHTWKPPCRNRGRVRSHAKLISLRDSRRGTSRLKSSN